MLSFRQIASAHPETRCACSECSYARVIRAQFAVPTRKAPAIGGAAAGPAKPVISSFKLPAKSAVRCARHISFGLYIAQSDQLAAMPHALSKSTAFLLLSRLLRQPKRHSRPHLPPAAMNLPLTKRTQLLRTATRRHVCSRPMCEPINNSNNACSCFFSAAIAAAPFRIL